MFLLVLLLSEDWKQGHDMRGGLTFIFEHWYTWIGLEEWWDHNTDFSSSGRGRKWGLLRWRRHWGREWQWRWGREWRSWWWFSQSTDECSPSRECSGMFSLPALVRIPGLGWWKIFYCSHPVWTHAMITLAVSFVQHLKQEVRILKASCGNEPLVLLFIVSMSWVLLLVQSTLK